MESVSTADATVCVAHVERRRLLDQLQALSQVPVVVMHAGAGFGKTTLAEQWALEDPRPHLSVQVAPLRDDPAALALALFDALEVVGADTAYVLVLDDVHLLSRPACQALVEAAVRGVPPGSQAALLGRDDPPPWLARWRADGNLVTLGADELAFDDRESRELLELLAVPLSGEHLADLVRHAEGWPAGLYLTALASRTRGGQLPPERGSGTGVDPFLRDYLMTEVLAGLDEPARQFLRRTSILDQITAPLADHVLDRQDSGAVLTTLLRQLQLVVPVAGEPATYRYHHLLADTLLADLAAHEPWLEPQLHRRASSWFEAVGDLDEAVRHAKAADDLELTGRLVWSGVPACIASGHPDRLASWLTDIPEARTRSNRWLCLATAWLGLQRGDADQMTRWLLAAEDHAGRGWESRVADDVYAAFLASIHITVGDFGIEGSITLCRAAEQGLPRDSAFRAAALHNEGVALTLVRRYAEGAESLQQAERLGRALGVPVIEANALAWRGMLAVLHDDWASGATLITRAGELVDLHHLERLATSANTITALALLRAARGDRDEARTTLGTARRLTSRVRRIAPWFAVVGPLVQARTAILLDEPALARTLLTEARRHLTPDLVRTVLPELLADTEALLHAFQDDQLLTESITPAQRRVLQFLPTRLTFDQIGEHLYLSRATVKSHAAAIYRKLAASSRDEAVERARILGLIEALPASDWGDDSSSGADARSPAG